MRELLNEDVRNETKNVNDDVVEDVEIYVNDNAKDEGEGNDLLFP